MYKLKKVKMLDKLLYLPVTPSSLPFSSYFNLLMEFVYDSADAAGQNGVTVTTWHACQWALKQISKEQPDIKIREFYIESRCSGDKGALTKNYIKGRGIEVQAEAYITESVLQNVLKVPCTM